MPEELQMEVRDIVQEAVIPSSRKRNAKRQNGYLGRLYKQMKKEKKQKAKEKRKEVPI